MTQTFTHDQLLAPETSLVLDEEASTISLWQAGERVSQQTFTNSEYRLLAFFLTHGTAIHCTYEEALSMVTHQSLETCQAVLQAARAKDEYEETHRSSLLQELKPVITTFEQCQARLHKLNIHVCAIWNYGYVLVRHEHEA